MYIYAFGSVCRGEIDKDSDIDLLAIIKEQNSNSFDTQKFSIYTEERLIELWNEGNPFAWHLFLESKLIYSETGVDFIQKLGKPCSYKNLVNDLEKFYSLYNSAVLSLKESNSSYIFDLSMIFLAMRNFASCYSLGVLNESLFSRNSAIILKSDRLNITAESFLILKRARIISTRGVGELINESELKKVLSEIKKITKWFDSLIKKYERI